LVCLLPISWWFASFSASAMANSSASKISLLFPRYILWVFRSIGEACHATVHPTLPDSSRDPSVKMLFSLVLAIDAFSMAVLLSSIITHPLVVGSVRVVLSTPYFGLMVCLRWFPRHFPSSILDERFGVCRMLRRGVSVVLEDAIGDNLLCPVVIW
jgi:hypothetical protein